MTYELRRLRLHGLIQRLLGSNTYTPHPNGVRMALSYTKVHERLLALLLAAAGSGTRSGSSTKSWPTPSPTHADDGDAGQGGLQAGEQVTEVLADGYADVAVEGLERDLDGGVACGRTIAVPEVRDSGAGRRPVARPCPTGDRLLAGQVRRRRARQEVAAASLP
jgi:hypothetical protein